MKTEAVAGVHDFGANYTPPASTSPADTAVIEQALEQGVISGTRVALAFAFVVVALGGLCSLLIPNSGKVPDVEHALRSVEGFEPLEPMDPDPALLEPAPTGRATG